MDVQEVYDNPLVGRYATEAMSKLWGPRRKFTTWRRLWVALAEAQAELGLLSDDGKTPRITAAQLQSLRDNVENIDFARAEKYEIEKRHDVAAHIAAYGDAAPVARGIIHL